MDISISMDNVCESLSRIFNASPESEDGEILFRPRWHKSGVTFPLEKLEQAISNVNECHFSETGVAIIRPKCIEVPVSVKGMYSAKITGLNAIQTYYKGAVCIAFQSSFEVCLIDLVKNIHRWENESKGMYWKEWQHNHYPSMDGIEFIQKTAPFYSLNIHGTEGIEYQEVDPLVNAVLFHVAYNSNVALMPVKVFSHHVPLGMDCVRRPLMKDAGVPTLVPDGRVVRKYINACGASDPASMYLSFYHILEDKFREVFLSEAVSQMREKIKSPAFSLEDDQDIVDLINVANRKVLRDKSEIRVSEEEALMLCIRKYCDREIIAEELEKISPGCVEHYGAHSVSFANSCRVDIKSNDWQTTSRNLGRRIYSVRNAIVHNKGGHEQAYDPLKHGEELTSETPLIRCVAERVIVRCSPTHNELWGVGPLRLNP